MGMVWTELVIIDQFHDRRFNKQRRSRFEMPIDSGLIL